MKKLLVLKGLPASGKSTYARELVAKGWKRVNKDELRAMIDDSKWSKSNEQRIRDVESTLVGYFLDAGMNVVVDSTNFAYEKSWEAKAKIHGAEFEVKFFDVALMECIERDAKRGDKSVGAKVILGMYNQYLKPKPVGYEAKLPDTYIFDIDGTLAKMNGRSPYDYTKVATDVMNFDVVVLASYIAKAHDVIIMSGRDSSCRKDTEEWLAKYDIKYQALYMRAEGDTRNDAIVKKELYEAHVKGKYNVLGVFDDRNRVVDLWRSLGLTCFQVDYGNF